MGTSTAFIILSTQRTGSSWLMDMLNNVEGNECHGELFLAEPATEISDIGCCEYERYIERKRRHRFGIRPFSTFSYLTGLFKRNGAVGFRLMYGQLRRFPEIILYIIFKRVRVIQLVRENLLDIIISYNVAMKSGKAHDSAGKEETKDTRVHLDPDQTLLFLGRMERNERLFDLLLRLLPVPKTRITYDQIRNEPESFSRLTEFLSLGSRSELPPSKLKKRQQKGHRESILNYAEIEAVLNAHGYGHYL